MKIKLRLINLFRPIAYPECDISIKLLELTQRYENKKRKGFSMKNVKALIALGKQLNFEIEYSGDINLVRFFK